MNAITTPTRDERRQAAIARINAERTIPLERYQEDGCESRFDYFKGLADNTGCKVSDVVMLAQMLGPDEDFDGLVTMLEDHCGEF